MRASLPERFLCARKRTEISGYDCTDGFTNAHAFGRKLDVCWDCPIGARHRHILATGREPDPTDINGMLREARAGRRGNNAKTTYEALSPKRWISFADLLHKTRLEPKALRYALNMLRKTGQAMRAGRGMATMWRKGEQSESAPQPYRAVEPPGCPACSAPRAEVRPCDDAPGTWECTSCGHVWDPQTSK